jgi:hypothetical protein
VLLLPIDKAPPGSFSSSTVSAAPVAAAFVVPAASRRVLRLPTAGGLAADANSKTKKKKAAAAAKGSGSSKSKGSKIKEGGGGAKAGKMAPAVSGTFPPPAPRRPYKKRAPKAGAANNHKSDTKGPTGRQHVVDEADRTLPEYDGTALAIEVFANPYFYRTKAGVDSCHVFREELLGRKTVDQVRREYLNVEYGIDTLAEEIGAMVSRLEAYFTTAGISIEQLLAERGIVALNAFGEIDRLHVCYVPGVPSPSDLVQMHSPPPNLATRNRRLSYVVGCSGSGKTFFALKELRNFGNAKKLPAVTLYVRPGDLDRKIDFRGRDVPERVVEQVYSLLERQLLRDKIVKLPSGWNRTKWKMHVCLVFDEAGAGALNGFFLNRPEVDALLDVAKKKIATSVMVVVVGTGTLGVAHDSTKEAYFFRMLPWKLADLEAVIKYRNLTLGVGESERTVANAVFCQPALAALSSNARSASFLVDCIEDTCRMARISWNDHISHIAPDLISRVVSMYSRENGIEGLDKPAGAMQKLRVAAWLFGALSLLEMDSAQLPELDGLNLKERAVALSLLQFNVELRNQRIAVSRDERYCVSVTPAIAVILYSLVGISTNVLVGWKGLEDTAALYAVRQLILDEWAKHVELRITPLQEGFWQSRRGATEEDRIVRREDVSLEEFEHLLWREGTLGKYEMQRMTEEKKLGRALEKLLLLRLRNQVLGQPQKGDVVDVPMVSDTTVLLNGDKSSFADVIAPYRLIQAKSSSEGTVAVNMTSELEKCCLLRETDDRRALRGLLAVWQGWFTPTPAAGAAAPTEPDAEPIPEHFLEKETLAGFPGAPAYPENLVDVVRRPPLDPVRAYMRIDSSGRVMLPASMSCRLLPSLPSPERPIEFTLFTNADEARVSFAVVKPRRRSDGVAAAADDDDRTIVVTRESLDGNLQVRNGAAVGDSEWDAFLAQRVLSGVTVKFVFTKPDKELRSK